MMPGTAAPQVIVEIRGAGNVGKSVVGQLLRRRLRAEGITTIGGRDTVLSPSDLALAITDLKARGLSVEIIEVATAGPIRPKRQIEARPPHLRPGGHQ